jgi:hypothetical protein
MIPFGKGDSQSVEGVMENSLYYPPGMSLFFLPLSCLEIIFNLFNNRVGLPSIFSQTLGLSISLDE